MNITSGLLDSASSKGVLVFLPCLFPSSDSISPKFSFLVPRQVKVTFRKQVMLPEVAFVCLFVS